MCLFAHNFSTKFESSDQPLRIIERRTADEEFFRLQQKIVYPGTAVSSKQLLTKERYESTYCMQKQARWTDHTQWWRHSCVYGFTTTDHASSHHHAAQW